jgi:hypothetical protein
LPQNPKEAWICYHPNDIKTVPKIFGMGILCYFRARMPYLKQIILNCPSNGIPMKSIMTIAMAVTVDELGSV